MINASYLFVALTAVAGCLHDLWNRRIPNYLTFGSAVLAVVYAGLTSGWPGVGAGVAGWILGVALFLPFFALRGMGAGDVKLLAALGAWVGPVELLTLTFYTAIVGGVMALIVVIWKRRLAETFGNVGLLLCTWRVGGVKPVTELSLDNKNSARLAYGVPIAIGALLTIWLR